MRRLALSAVLLLVAGACSSSPPPDVRGSLIEYLPERLVKGDAVRASVVLGLDDIGYIDELQYAMSDLGFPVDTVYRIAMAAEDDRQTATGDGVVAHWTYHPQRGPTVVIEHG